MDQQGAVDRTHLESSHVLDEKLLNLFVLGILVIDNDGVYDLSDFNDRLLLGLKSQMSEYLCRYRHQTSYADSPVMRTICREDAAGLAGVVGMSA